MTDDELKTAQTLSADSDYQAALEKIAGASDLPPGQSGPPNSTPPPAAPSPGVRSSTTESAVPSIKKTASDLLKEIQRRSSPAGVAGKIENIISAFGAGEFISSIPKSSRRRLWRALYWDLIAHGGSRSDFAKAIAKTFKRHFKSKGMPQLMTLLCAQDSVGRSLLGEIHDTCDPLCQMRKAVIVAIAGGSVVHGVADDPATGNQYEIHRRIGELFGVESELINLGRSAAKAPLPAKLEWRDSNGNVKATSLPMEDCLSWYEQAMGGTIPQVTPTAEIVENAYWEVHTNQTDGQSQSQGSGVLLHVTSGDGLVSFGVKGIGATTDQEPIYSACAIFPTPSDDPKAEIATLLSDVQTGALKVKPVIPKDPSMTVNKRQLQVPNPVVNFPVPPIDTHQNFFMTDKQLCINNFDYDPAIAFLKTINVADLVNADPVSWTATSSYDVPVGTRIFFWMLAQTHGGQWVGPFPVKRAPEKSPFLLPSNSDPNVPDPYEVLWSTCPPAPAIRIASFAQWVLSKRKNPLNGRPLWELQFQVDAARSALDAYVKASGIIEFDLLVFRKPPKLDPQTLISAKALSSPDLDYYSKRDWYQALIAKGWSFHQWKQGISLDQLAKPGLYEVGGWDIQPILIGRRDPDTCYQVKPGNIFVPAVNIPSGTQPSDARPLTTQFDKSDPYYAPHTYLRSDCVPSAPVGPGANEDGPGVRVLYQTVPLCRIEGAQVDHFLETIVRGSPNANASARLSTLLDSYIFGVIESRTFNPGCLGFSKNSALISIAKAQLQCWYENKRKSQLDTDLLQLIEIRGIAGLGHPTPPSVDPSLDLPILGLRFSRVGSYAASSKVTTQFTRDPANPDLITIAPPLNTETSKLGDVMMIKLDDDGTSQSKVAFAFVAEISSALSSFKLEFTDGDIAGAPSNGTATISFLTSETSLGNLNYSSQATAQDRDGLLWDVIARGPEDDFCWITRYMGPGLITKDNDDETDVLPTCSLPLLQPFWVHSSITPSVPNLVGAQPLPWDIKYDIDIVKAIDLNGEDFRVVIQLYGQVQSDTSLKNKGIPTRSLAELINLVSVGNVMELSPDEITRLVTWLRTNQNPDTLTVKDMQTTQTLTQVCGLSDLGIQTGETLGKFFLHSVFDASDVRRHEFWSWAMRVQAVANWSHANYQLASEFTTGLTYLRPLPPIIDQLSGPVIIPRTDSGNYLTHRIRLNLNIPYRKPDEIKTYNISYSATLRRSMLVPLVSGPAVISFRQEYVTIKMLKSTEGASAIRTSPGGGVQFQFPVIEVPIPPQDILFQSGGSNAAAAEYVVAFRLTVNDAHHTDCVFVRELPVNLGVPSDINWTWQESAGDEYGKVLARIARPARARTANPFKRHGWNLIKGSLFEYSGKADPIRLPFDFDVKGRNNGVILLEIKGATKFGKHRNAVLTGAIYKKEKFHKRAKRVLLGLI